jgi:hypothetical protein
VDIRVIKESDDVEPFPQGGDAVNGVRGAADVEEEFRPFGSVGKGCHGGNPALLSIIVFSTYQ